MSRHCTYRALNPTACQTPTCCNNQPRPIQQCQQKLNMAPVHHQKLSWLWWAMLCTPYQSLVCTPIHSILECKWCKLVVCIKRLTLTHPLWCSSLIKLTPLDIISGAKNGTDSRAFEDLLCMQNKKSPYHGSLLQTSHIFFLFLKGNIKTIRVVIFLARHVFFLWFCFCQHSDSER